MLLNTVYKNILSSFFITDATGYVDQHIQYLPFGELFISQRNSTFDSRYKFTAKELDNETNYTYFGARYYDSDISIWLSVDPLAQERSWLSPYNYCQWNPLIKIDQKGELDSPIFDTQGNFLGTDSEGYKGKVLIFKDPLKFEEGMSHKKAMLIGKEFKSERNLSDVAENKIFKHVMSGTEFPDGDILKSNEFNPSVKSMSTANARYLGVENGKHTVDLDIGDFEWTVENIRALTIHEIWGHGVKQFGDETKTHHKCYFAEIDSKYWESTTLRFKTHALKTMWNYYYNEVGYKPLPKKYDIEYRKYIK